MASSSSSLNWLYDVFLSFRGEDIRTTFFSHVFKEFDRKLINTFKDYEIKKSHSLWPVLQKAIWRSRIAVVVFSTNYASSSWCLNELLEIVNCKDKPIIPVFYGVDPSHVRKQNGDFGKVFEETCKNNTDEVKDLWKKALTDVSNMVGFDFANCDKNEAKMIEEIATDVLRKLLSTSSKDFENFVGIEDHMAKMSELLQLESKEVRMVGIWGSSGIGKTIIARALYNQLPQRFQGSIFIDRAFVSKSKEIYRSANPDDYNMKLYLQEQFLLEILGIKDIKIGHLGALRERLQHQKVLIIIDDLDDLMVLDSLVGQTQWFGSGSRIILVTNDKHFLRALSIDHIYEISLPTEEHALAMLCQSAFRQSFPHEDFEKVAVEVVRHVDSLPLALNVLGSSLRGRNKEYWMDMLSRLHNGLDDIIEKVVRVSYDGLGSVDDQTVFLYIACLFNHMEVTTIKTLLADSNLGVNIALQNLADKSLIHVEQGYVVMHSSLQAMGRKIVLALSTDKLGKRQFLVDQKDICDVLNESTGTQNVLGISLNARKIDELHVHESAFKGMRLHLPLNPKLLSWDSYPRRRMASKFRPENLAELKMSESNLEKLWEGFASLGNLKEMDMSRSHSLKDIPDLSMATNLEKLVFSSCSILVELPSSIGNLNSLEILPTGINLKSLDELVFHGCSQLRSFPGISTNISMLNLSETEIEEVPRWIENFSRLVSLTMKDCSKLKCVSLNISKLKHLEEVNFSYCRALTRVDLSGYEVAMEADNIDTVPEESSSLSDDYVPKAKLHFVDCFKLDQEALLQQQSIIFDYIILPGEEVPSYFTHRTTEDSLTNIPLLHSSPSQPFFKLRACAVVDRESIFWNCYSFSIQVYFRFKDRHGNHFDYADFPKYFKKIKDGSPLLVFDCCFTLNEDNTPLAELNYDHVDIQFHFVDAHSKLKVKGCGIHLLEDGHYLDDRPCNPFIHPEVYEGDNNTGNNFGGSKFYEKSTSGDNFLGEVNSDSTSTMVTDERHMPQHQVFINFWGEEVRFSFISHLVFALSRKQVDVFQGKCEDLENTFQSIEDSKIAIVIFSSTYAESRRCLEELVEIKEQMDEDRIIPIFYNVKLSDVKELGGDFGFQFWNLWRAHRDHRIINWKQALESVASIKGLELEEKSSESQFITLIVEEVLRMISSQKRENPDGFSTRNREKHKSFLNKCSLFGLEQRMKQLEHKLEFDCDETRIIGVVGIAGIGKTTLAMMLHEKWNCDFIRCAALLDIREKLKDNEWLKKTLFEVLLEGECYKTDESLKGELLETKVFVVLDDVSNKKQLEFLLGDLNWIKKGSKIVITSRDKSLIEEFVHDTYVVPPLNYGEALDLFRYHAVGDKVFHPSKMCREFVDCTGGNPLVIKLLVKKLNGGDYAKWEMRQEDLTNLRMVILNIFRSSFDELSDKQKDVFLDIACFFRSENDSFVRSLLDSGDYNAIGSESEVRDLTHKCMIAISGCRVEMHDLMYMFSQAFIEENGGKSRLWYTQEIFDALTNQKDTKSIRGIFLDMSEVIQSIVLDSTTFSNMCNLRYLKIYESCCPRKGKSDCKLRFPDGLRFPLKEVRYLHWLKFPLKELPGDFRPENLVDLRLPYSKIERVWEGVKDIPKLKWVDLSHSRKLLNLSVLARAESLQRLNLEGCTNLEKFPREMQSMKSLVYLNMRGCIRLMSLPKMNLISLKTLILSYCSNLKEFQVISKKLEVLHLDGTAIKELPVAIQKLQRLVVLNLKNCKMLECLPNCLGKLKVLEEIILSGCSRLKNLPDVRYSMKHVQILLFDGAGVDEMPNTSCFIGYEGQTSIDVPFQKIVSYGNPRELPRGVSRVSSLRRLSFSGNDFVSLQNDIVQLYNLIWLDVKQCKKLTSVPMLPPRLQYFDAHGCDSLEKVANPLALQVLTEQIHATYNFSNCNKLDQDATDAIISYTQWKSQMILDALSRYNGGFSTEALIGTCFPGWEVPAWFSYRAFGSSLEPKLPPHWCDSGFIGIALCAVILFPASQNQQKNLIVKCNFEFKNEDGSGNRFSCHVGGLSSEPGETIESSHVFISYASKLDIKKFHEDNEEGCICTEASFRFQVTDGTKELGDCEVLKCGFSLVYASDDLQVNSGAYRSPVEVNQDITSSCWVKDFFGFLSKKNKKDIFLAFSCVIVFAILKVYIWLSGLSNVKLD